MTRSRKDHDVVGQFGKGSLVLVTWPVDGHPYEAKVVDVKGDSVRVHYATFNPRHDEWLLRDDPRLDWQGELEALSSSRHSDGGAAKASHSQPTNRLSTSRCARELSAERLIDTLYDSVCPEPTEPGQTKRSRDDSSNELGSSPKRQLLRLTDDTAASILNSPASQRANQDGAVQSQAAAIVAAPGDAGGSGDSTTQSAPISQAGSTGVPSNPTPNEAGTASLPPNLCGLCSLPAGRNMVQCSRCQLQFHPSVICLGVAAEVASVLGSDRSGALLYRCCVCRSGEPFNGDSVVQLTRIVGELVRSVKSRDSNNVSAGAAAPREAIITQIREVREREKRKDSIIFRGMGDVSMEVLTRNFEVICDLLNVDGVTLTDIRKIGSSPPLYRARIHDDAKRRELLLRCHQLRNSEEFSRVYIHRDLTLQQRRDLMVKRNQARPQVSSSSHRPASRTHHSSEQRTLGNFVPRSGDASRHPNRSGRGGQAASASRGSAVASRMLNLQRTRDDFVRGNVDAPPRPVMSGRGGVSSHPAGLNQRAPSGRNAAGGLASPTGQGSQANPGLSSNRGRPPRRWLSQRRRNEDRSSNANFEPIGGGSSSRRMHPRDHASPGARGLSQERGTRDSRHTPMAPSGRRVAKARRRGSLRSGLGRGNFPRGPLEAEHWDQPTAGDHRSPNDFGHPILASSPLPPARERSYYGDFHRGGHDANTARGRGGSSYFPRRSLN